MKFEWNYVFFPLLSSLPSFLVWKSMNFSWNSVVAKLHIFWKWYYIRLILIEEKSSPPLVLIFSKFCDGRTFFSQSFIPAAVSYRMTKNYEKTGRKIFLDLKCLICEGNRPTTNNPRKILYLEKIILQPVIPSIFPSREEKKCNIWFDRQYEWKFQFLRTPVVRKSPSTFALVPKGERWV